MVFDPAEFAVLGKTLAASDGYHVEARTRTTLGRAYYALFLAVRTAVYTAARKSVDGNIGHGDLTNVLFSSRNDDLIAVGTLLNSLYSARQKADYKLIPDGSWAKKLVDPGYAALRAKEAEDAIRKLSTLNFTTVIGKV